MRHKLYSLLLGLALLTACGTAPPVPLVEQEVGPTPLQALSPTVSPVPPGPTATSVPSPTTVAAAPTLVPTATPAALAAAATAQRIIDITEPQPGATADGTLVVRGSTNFWPFEATLVAQIRDAAGNVLGMTPVMVQAPDIGQGGPFEGTVEFTAPDEPQAGSLEVFEASAKDGSIVVLQTVPVQLMATKAQTGVQLDAPVEGAAITLPLHVAVRGVGPNDSLLARLRWSNGTVLERPVPVVAGPDGVGYGVANIQWNTESAPPPTPPGDATFELLQGDGTVVKRIAVQMLSDEATQHVDVAWAAPDTQELIVFKQAIERSPQVATAALRELLNGPPDGNAAGATTALPILHEILTYSERQPDWDYRVKLLKLTISNGIATANFSKELRAYGGGSARVQMIRQQIERTLRQFPSVQQVVIQIEGQSGDVLQP